MDKNEIAKHILISGVVQGVGFRPFVYRLAHKFFLKGEIFNTSEGISIHVEGKEPDIAGFTHDLECNAPSLARITEVRSFPDEVTGYQDFSISESIEGNSMLTLISPDISVCDDCVRELFDPQDRRYRYPFINCTNCGPRYTIIDNIPYDRNNTSMKKFIMCEKCKEEYNDPLNRRFHAQPNACEVCGPHVSLYNNKRQEIESNDPIRDTVKFLQQGSIIAIKGLGGFHLAADAESDSAVKRLRKGKNREEKPFAVMSFNLEKISEYAFFSMEEELLLKSIQRPIVLLKKRGNSALSKQVSPGNKYYGVMLPYTPLHYLVLESFRALVMTSANLSDEPIAVDNEDAFTRLSAICDYFLVHDRDILIRSDDSIISQQSGSTDFIRRSRGYVPFPVVLKNNHPAVLGCGAELKNTICIIKNTHAFLSQHIGDLENRAAYAFYIETVKHMKRVLDINPEIVACDLHPDYLSTRYALEQKDVQLVRVQHHHAHIAACMAENRVNGDVIGLSFDGTGYGPDGSVWGGEILIADFIKYKRVSTIAPVAMPGSSAAIKEPWRMGISYLYETFGEDLLDLDIPFINLMPECDVKITMKMISRNINSPVTSSLGRLFDGVSAICGFRSLVHYEGQAAMELEMAACDTNEVCYNYAFKKEDDVYIINPAPLFKDIVNDLLNRTDAGVISARFHGALIKMYSELCGIISSDTGLVRIALSGGVFQNSLFSRGLVAALENRGLNVYTHKSVPPNDGGISLGQAVVAAVAVH
ncbi:MAG: carbamoyltransferase HypF [Deltaproteobacteria bacterium]|nr:carbamoyltransferase HypF [Deltaproteobacteria bacterium]